MAFWRKLIYKQVSLNIDSITGELILTILYVNQQPPVLEDMQ